MRKRQAEYFYGRLAARFALDALGSGLAEVETGAHREPLWPQDIVGSITLNRNYAAAVVLPTWSGAGVGVDIETIAAGESLATIQVTAMCMEELDLLLGLAGRMSMATLVTLIFSAKESFFKAAFQEVGRYFDFDAVYVGAIDLDARKLTLHVRYWLAERLSAGATRDVYFEFLDDETICTSCRWYYG